ncbi:MAG TPA: RidA family protein [Candidatus Brocadiia bacterium]|nr:RidA family protein [Candidatus Brocadiia bacterium]
MNQQRAVKHRLTRLLKHPGCDIAIVAPPGDAARPGIEEMCLTLCPLPGESAAGMARRLASELSALGAQTVKHDVFGPVASYGEFMGAWRSVASGADCPITWVAGASCSGASLAGIHVRAVKGAPVETVRTPEGRPAGRTYCDGHARYCLLGGIGPDTAGAERGEQALETFKNIRTALGTVGMAMSNVVRTWFYIDHILDWYGRFNEVRTDFFRRTGVFEGVVPASTGIGGGNPDGTAVVAGCLAVEPVAGDMAVSQLSSPLQGSAQDYGSSFARAVETQVPGLRTVYVSGTASIAPDGRTVREDDVAGQTELTMRVVSAILESRGMSYADATRALVYFKRAEDAPAYDRYARANGLGGMPVIVTHNDICRDDLLFEIEIDASASV